MTTGWSDRSSGVAIIGLSSWHSGTGINKLLYNKVEEGLPTAIEPTFITTHGVEDGCELVSDDLDAGIPGYRKVWRKVALWVGDGMLSSAAAGTKDQWTVSLSVDRGDTWAESVQVQITKDASVTDAERILQFWFTPLMGETVRVRITNSTGLTLYGELYRMAVDYQLLGEVEPYAENPS